MLDTPFQILIQEMRWASALLKKKQFPRLRNICRLVSLRACLHCQDPTHLALARKAFQPRRREAWV